MNDKNTRIISSSQFISNFGTAMTRISLVILISTWFSNPIYIGLYSFFLFVPGIVFASPIGSLVDNCRNLKRLLVETLVLSLLSVLAILLFFASIFEAFLCWCCWPFYIAYYVIFILQLLAKLQ